MSNTAIKLIYGHTYIDWKSSGDLPWAEQAYYRNGWEYRTRTRRTPSTYPLSQLGSSLSAVPSSWWGSQATRSLQPWMYAGQYKNQCFLNKLTGRYGHPLPWRLFLSLRLPPLEIICVRTMTIMMWFQEHTFLDVAMQRINDDSDTRGRHFVCEQGGIFGG